MHDLIIIGGGMSGISVAHHFRDHDILILERDELLAEASGKNAGFVIGGFGEHFSRTVARLGLRHAVEIQEIHRSCHKRMKEVSTILDGSYQTTGSYALAVDEREREELLQSCELLQNQGYSVEWIERPETGLIDCRGALLNREDGILDSSMFWRRMADNLPVQTHCEVRSVQNQVDSIRIETSQGSFTTERVVFCLNAFAGELVPETRGRFIPVRGQMLEIPLQDRPKTNRPIFTHRGDIYWRYLNHTLIFGGLECMVPEKEVGIARDVSLRIQDAQIHWIQDHFDPILVGNNPRPSRSWSGTMAFTVDGFPFVGRLPQKNRYILGGLCGLGHSYAMECAFWLHELILHRRNVIPPYCSSDRIDTLPLYEGGDWRRTYEAWNHGIH